MNLKLLTLRAPLILSLIAGLWLAESSNAGTIYEDYTFVTFVGPDAAGAGWFDGPGSVARFSSPGGIARDASGNLYVADSRNNTIRKITPDGSVTTLAGLNNSSGAVNGQGAGATFNSPFGVAVDSGGNVYVSDSASHVIRKISSSGVVTTLAGLAGVPGATNGVGNAARFNSPNGLALDSGNNLYVADTGNHVIRKITPAGVVSTLAGSAGNPGSVDKTGTAARFNSPVGVAVDKTGNIYVADTANATIRKITAGGVVSTLAGLALNPGSADGTNKTARFTKPYNLAVDSHTNLFVVDTFNHTLRKVAPDGVVTTLAGGVGVAGSTDNTGLAARFNFPVGIVVDDDTNLFVSDFSNNAIRKVTPGLVVTTFAGFPTTSGSVDGTGNAARLNFPSATAFDGNGNAYVTDLGNHTIRKIDPSGAVITLAGLAGTAGTNNGTGSAARFSGPTGLAVAGNGQIFVADSSNHIIRAVSPLGDVSTFAGFAGVSGANDGTNDTARFNQPFGVAVDGEGNVFVGDTHNHAIRKITPDGVVTTIAGVIGSAGTNDGPGLTAKFNFPEHVALDGNGNLYVADDDNFTIRKIASDDSVTTFAGAPRLAGSADGTNANFNFPFGVAVDLNSNVYVGDTANSTIRKISPAGVVTTIGGSPGVAGSQDGTGSDARFSSPEGVTVDNQGNVYVADAGNHSIRKGYPALTDHPIVDLPAARVGVSRHFSISNLTTTSWSWKLVRRPAGSTAQFSATNISNPTFTPDVEDIYVVQFQGWDNSGRTTIKRLTLYADNTPPSVAITSPVSGQISSGGVRGTATDNFGVSNVWVQINGGAWIRATGTTSWSADVAPSVGTNIVRAYAEDLAGNVSQTNSIDFLYGTPITVILNGGGSVTPNLNGQLLEIGQTYSMTAQAGPGCAFINWTGSLTTNSPTLTFVMQSNLTFTANFTDPIRPTLVITSPQKGLHISNAVFTATGTATDNGQLAAVWYRLNGGVWLRATNTSNWTAGLPLTDSANTLEAYAVDTFTNVSTTNSVAFTYVPSSRITVVTTGLGTLAPNYNGWMLQNGKSYTMTAKPAFNYVFYKWTDNAGNTLATVPGFTFVVQSNLTVRANFIVNPFVSLTGPFAGLFYDTNNIATTNSGFFSITLASAGSFTAKIQLTSGQKISTSGRFTLDGVFSNSVAVKGSAPFVVQLRLDAVNQGRITGTVSSADWTAPLLAVRAIFSPANPAPQSKRPYTLVIPGGEDSSARPGGNGFGTLIVDISGNVNFSGVLADGAKVKQKTFINKQGIWPLYVAPYQGQGAIFGWMTFVTNQNNADLTGTLNWFRLPQATAAVYPGGFDFPGGISAVGSIYSFTNGTPLLHLPAGGLSILQLGNPTQSFTNNFTLGTDNKITSSNGLTATITTSSGLFKGTAISLGNGTSVPLNGVLLPKQNSGFGFFLSNGQSGSVYLGP